MAHFLQAIVSPTAILMFFIFLYAISVHSYTGFRERRGLLLWPILWVIVAILALIAWLSIVFS